MDGGRTLASINVLLLSSPKETLLVLLLQEHQLHLIVLECTTPGRHSCGVHLLSSPQETLLVLLLQEHQLHLIVLLCMTPGRHSRSGRLIESYPCWRHIMRPRNVQTGQGRVAWRAGFSARIAVSIAEICSISSLAMDVRLTTSITSLGLVSTGLLFLQADGRYPSQRNPFSCPLGLCREIALRFPIHSCLIDTPLVI